MTIVVHPNSRFARWILPETRAAFTLGVRVYSVGPITSEVLAHEVVHVEQFLRWGLEGFLLRHIWYALRFGYDRNPIEEEARRRRPWNLAHWGRLDVTVLEAA